MIPKHKDTILLQECMKALHIYRGPLDGVFSPETQEALMRFQRALDLPVKAEPTKAVIEHAKATLALLNKMPKPTDADTKPLPNTK